MDAYEDLIEHLKTGATTVCRAWAVIRRDGAWFGFTDHDLDLECAGKVYRANTGMSAGSLQQATGLSVDNTEAIGALSDAAISEADIHAGRFDGAEVEAWLVNWAQPKQRALQFRGNLGELKRANGAFQAELRGLTEILNQPQGRVYQSPCSAVLGDHSCRFDLSGVGYSTEVLIETVTDRRVLVFAGMQEFEDRWFERGRFKVLSGPATGLIAIVKNDRLTADRRQIELWEPLGADMLEGDMVRLEAGCDKRADTCRLKFNNFTNFQGFPHIPGEDWLMGYPSDNQPLDGGSLFK